MTDPYICDLFYTDFYHKDGRNKMSYQ